MSSDREDVVRQALADAAGSVTSDPPDPATLRTGRARQHAPVRSRRVWLPALAAAAAVAAVSTATVLLLHDDGSARTGAGAPPPSPAGTARSSTGPAACTSLAPTVDPSRTGPAGGTENVVFLLRNTGARSCRLAGLVTLRGVTSNGSAVGLGFHSSLDPAYADPSPANGPGIVAPGALGALHVTLQLNDCATSAVRYARLQIRFASGASVDMHFPAQLAASGCYGFIAQPGPIAR